MTGGVAVPVDPADELAISDDVGVADDDRDVLGDGLLSGLALGLAGVVGWRVCTMPWPGEGRGPDGAAGLAVVAARATMTVTRLPAGTLPLGSTRST